MYNSKTDKLLEKVKLVFDLVRLPFYFIVVAAKLFIIACGIGCAAYLVYKGYKLYSAWNLGPIGTFIFLFLVLPVAVGIGKGLYYIVFLICAFVGLAAIPFKYENDIVVDIECFVEDLPYHLFSWKRDEQAQFLGFKNMAEFAEFNKTHNELYKQYDQEDIEEFRSEKFIEK